MPQLPFPIPTPNNCFLIGYVSNRVASPGPVASTKKWNSKIFWGFVRGLPLIVVLALVLLLPLPIQAQEDVGVEEIPLMFFGTEPFGSEPFGIEPFDSTQKNLSLEELEYTIFGTAGRSNSAAYDRLIENEEVEFFGDGKKTFYDRLTDHEIQPLPIQPADSPFDD